MFQPEADIYLNRLKENFRNIQSIVEKAKIMAVIKANAYGHGLIPIAKTLSESGVHGFCVALTNEAEVLVHSGIQEPIIHLGRIHKRNLELYKSGQIRCTINSKRDLEDLEKYHSKSKPVIAHLKIDTGMGRMGVRFEETEAIMRDLYNVPQIIFRVSCHLYTTIVM